MNCKETIPQLPLPSVKIYMYTIEGGAPIDKLPFCGDCGKQLASLSPHTNAQ
jgi:hypothetical protein